MAEEQRQPELEVERLKEESLQAISAVLKYSLLAQLFIVDRWLAQGAWYEPEELRWDGRLGTVGNRSGIAMAMERGDL